MFPRGCMAELLYKWLYVWRGPRGMRLQWPIKPKPINNSFNVPPGHGEERAWIRQNLLAVDLALLTQGTRHIGIQWHGPVCSNDEQVHYGG